MNHCYICDSTDTRKVKYLPKERRYICVDCLEASIGNYIDLLTADNINATAPRKTKEGDPGDTPLPTYLETELAAGGALELDMEKLK